MTQNNQRSTRLCENAGAQLPRRAIAEPRFQHRRLWPRREAHRGTQVPGSGTLVSPRDLSRGAGSKIGVFGSLSAPLCGLQLPECGPSVPPADPARDAGSRIGGFGSLSAVTNRQIGSPVRYNPRSDFRCPKVAGTKPANSGTYHLGSCQLPPFDRPPGCGGHISCQSPLFAGPPRRSGLSSCQPSLFAGPPRHSGLSSRQPSLFAGLLRRGGCSSCQPPLFVSLLRKACQKNAAGKRSNAVLIALDGLRGMFSQVGIEKNHGMLRFALANRPISAGFHKARVKKSRLARSDRPDKSPILASRKQLSPYPTRQPPQLARLRSPAGSLWGWQELSSRPLSRWSPRGQQEVSELAWTLSLSAA